MEKQDQESLPSSMEEELTPPDRISVATTATSTDGSLPVAVDTNRQPTLFQLTAPATSDEENNNLSSSLQGVKTNLNKRRFERVEVLSLDDDSDDDDSSDDDLLPQAYNKKKSWSNKKSKSSDDENDFGKGPGRQTINQSYLRMVMPTNVVSGR